MGNLKNEIAALFEVLGKTFYELTDKQYQDLLEGKGKLVFKGINKVVKEKKDGQLDLEIEEICNEIMRFNSREEAQAYFTNLRITKSSLLKITNRFKIHTLKSDKKEDIIHKIIESVIGAKLRSSAIQSTNLKGK